MKHYRQWWVRNLLYLHNEITKSELGVELRRADRALSFVIYMRDKESAP